MRSYSTREVLPGQILVYPLVASVPRSEGVARAFRIELSRPVLRNTEFIVACYVSGHKLVGVIGIDVDTSDRVSIRG